MPRFPLVCQTITFGPDQKDRLPEVFAAVAAAGYDGVEVGLRHIDHLPPAEVADLLDEHGLQLYASHTGGDLSGPSGKPGGETLLEHAVRYLNAVGTELLVYSGLQFQDEAQFAGEFDALNSAAETAQTEGVRLCYHNHDFEFEHDGRAINAVLDDASEALALCPDLGWVHMGGADVVGFLERAKNRLAAVHFKDFSTTDADWDTVILGEGVAPLEAGARWLIEHTDGMPVMAEQDTAAVPAAEAVGKNAGFLRRVFGTA